MSGSSRSFYLQRLLFQQDSHLPDDSVTMSRLDCRLLEQHVQKVIFWNLWWNLLKMYHLADAAAQS